MKLEEALPALRAGKKIRRKCRQKQKHIKMHVGYAVAGRIINQNSVIYDLTIMELEADDWEILKETKKVKLRDLTEEQCCRWVKINCEKLMDEENCEGCPFVKVVCTPHVLKWWFYHQDIFNNKFLDQEIEVEE